MYYDPADFPFTRIFEDHWKIMRDEFRRLDRRLTPFHRLGPHETYVARLLKDNAWMPGWQVGSNEPNYNWLTYGLSYAGLFPQDSAERYPETRRLLAGLTGFKVCAFLLMRPQFLLGPHKHPELGSNLLIYHLGLQVIPRQSFVCVDGVFEGEGNGKSIIFDGTREHFAFNAGLTERVILYMEFDKNQVAFNDRTAAAVPAA